ncbi:P-loop NTPase family protein [Pontibacillus marinus]|uniref:Uncharacterized protein n=1 Tax=Pontibacillus marinus BH030004 = DSM 16465 TaxID=1385511 RepID=A0A0A5GKW7_9BACI|nr:ATP-binding protein [Pontibacillus marinus]KGX91863.1 hypothetical protein N783_00210 [Pontibacillus marinus BH030004 = DSM 16465]
MEGNPFVYYLDQYNVLSPNHAKIYDEYTHDENSGINYHFNVHTQIEDTLVNLFESKPQSVILTGNAGDGKTRLCRMIHNHFNEHNELTTWPEEGIIEFPFKNGKIRIVKDLSELKEDVILRELSLLQDNIQTQHTNKTYYLIAANEGKLTKFLSQHNEVLSLLNKEVLKRFESHEHNSNQFSIFNLLDVTSSVYVNRVLEDWNKDENWHPCQSCPKQDRCIIYMNHERTSNDHIQQKIVEQYQMLDYLDTHITLREMLIHISFMLTGGYTCEDVLEADYTDLKEQIKRPYYQNFYGQELSENAFSEMKALRLFKTLDPGNYSHSSIDDFIINGDINGDEDLEKIYENLFGKTLDLELGYFQKKLALYRDYNIGSDQSLIDEWIPKLRRKFFYELEDNHIFKPNQLLPYEYLSDYKSMFDDIKNQKATKKVLIGGLNRVFSGRLTKETKHLYATNKNLMVYDTFKQNKDVKLIEESERYDLDRKPSTFTLWVDDEVELPLNLAIFEYLMRASGGGTHNILQQDAEILVDTFKNELIRISDADDYILNILRYDSDEGLFIEDEITLD